MFWLYLLFQLTSQPDFLTQDDHSVDSSFSESVELSINEEEAGKETLPAGERFCVKHLGLHVQIR